MRRALLAALSIAAGAVAACATVQRPPAFQGLPPDDPDATLSVVWIGHATALIRIGDRHVLTDPNLNGTLLVVPRETPASVKPRQLPFVDVAVVSHLHWDHFDRGTIRQLRPTTALVLPPDSERYVGGLPQRRREALDAWESTTVRGLTITSVPVSHFGGRYGLDALWNDSYAGYVIEGFGHKVFFAGDTGWHPELFKEIGRRYPGIELALVPIAPYRPGSIGSRVHANPAEALEIAKDVGAAKMIPIHYEAYYGGWMGYDRPRQELVEAARVGGWSDRVHALRTGERWQHDGAALAKR